MNTFDRAYIRAANDVARLPGPCIQPILERLLQAQPDPADDAAAAAGYRQALTDTLNQIRSTP